ncbi:MAG TPA: glycosyltransferase [Leptolyngbyaceae cyanobacterium M33_DOE_097]|uniref:Glycosyltransferase n=1 Tax=Oscillatoriales cyanobacterium SpSt-418 TaxID=2282169 RepID=A0A7C3PMP7_9CYAN|nr:glycosyltransferase [Leptolyngbyaceae cyanobacterium M33_DOE_097]
MSQIGIVAIGRNEGDRLKQCLQSVVGKAAQVVYVDSGSTDGSVEMAASLGVDVVALDLSTPFTAARARNAGFARLLELRPALDYVQFVDGDCEVVEGWLDKAQQMLDAHPEIVVVCGRRRERYPEKSLFNRLCEIEWDTPIGEAKACGGDAMMRAKAVQAVGGYNPNLIAGEEPELCVRLRQKGGKIWRMDAEMTLHDAAMTRTSQWWKRSKRSGHAFAEGAFLHGASPERHWVRESRSIWLWGVMVPSVALVGAWFTHGFSLLLLLAYPLIMFKIYRYLRSTGRSPQESRLYAIACVVGKFAEAQGLFQFHWNRLLGKRSQLIEYNTSAST